MYGKITNFIEGKKGKAVSGYLEIKKDQVLERERKRVYTVHSGNAECYFLRLLLHKIPGPTSFTALKIVAGVVQPTFQAACKALSLLEDDAHWNSTLEEASISEFPNKIRELFAIILVFCQVGDPIKLWEKHQDSLSEDVKKQIEAEQGNINLYLDIVYNQCLTLLDDIVISMSDKALLHFGFLSPSREARFAISNHQYVNELAYDTIHLSKIVAENVPKLNQEQKEIYDKILSSITSNSGQCYFLDSPGETGKTFLINLLLAKIGCERSIAIAVASSGIAATLIDGGKTHKAHSAFKLALTSF
ncbi:ATP-dependent DNA helicase [Trichonephila clavipes]|nr:ATP-dependent DNA helicase [Trichonephila clavipes]